MNILGGLVWVIVSWVAVIWAFVTPGDLRKGQRDLAQTLAALDAKLDALAPALERRDRGASPPAG